jgi:hypothetical protein
VAQKNKSKIKKFHVEVPHRRNVEIPCLGVTPGGYPKESSVCKGGILKKKFTGGIPKPTYFAGGYQLFNPKNCSKRKIM